MACAQVPIWFCHSQGSVNYVVAYPKPQPIALARFLGGLL